MFGGRQCPASSYSLIGSADYWIGKAMLDLGPTGIVVVPPIVNLTRSAAAWLTTSAPIPFKNPDLSQATPR